MNADRDDIFCPRCGMPYHPSSHMADEPCSDQPWEGEEGYVPPPECRTDPYPSRLVVE